MASKKKPARKTAATSAAKVSSSKAEPVEAQVEYAQVEPVPVPVPEVERPPNPNPGWECLDINRKALIWFILVILGFAIATFIGMIPVLANLTKAEMKKILEEIYVCEILNSFLFFWRKSLTSKAFEPCS